MAVRHYRKVDVPILRIRGLPHKGKPLGGLSCDGKLSRTVLRGLGAGNSPRLPGMWHWFP